MSALRSLIEGLRRDWPGTDCWATLVRARALRMLPSATSALRVAHHLGAMARNVSKTPDIFVRLLRGRAARDLPRAIP